MICIALFRHMAWFSSRVAAFTIFLGTNDQECDFMLANTTRMTLMKYITYHFNGNSLFTFYLKAKDDRFIKARYRTSDGNE